MINISARRYGELTVSEAIEREPLGSVSNTVMIDHILDSDYLVDVSEPLFYFMNELGIVFISTDNMVSFFSDGKVECREFIEGSRLAIDNIGRILITQLREI